MTSFYSHKYRIVVKPINTHITKKCTGCLDGVIGEDSVVCDCCKMARYCTAQCAEQDKQSHERWCSTVQETGHWYTEDALRRLVKIFEQDTNDASVQTLRVVLVCEKAEGEEKEVMCFTTRTMPMLFSMMEQAGLQDSFTQTMLYLLSHAGADPCTTQFIFCELMKDGDCRMSPVMLTHKNICTHCTKEATSEKLWDVCARCRGEAYCSTECQRAAWPRHKKWCKLVKPRELQSARKHLLFCRPK